MWLTGEKKSVNAKNPNTNTPLFSIPAIDAASITTANPLLFLSPFAGDVDLHGVCRQWVLDVRWWFATNSLFTEMDAGYLRALPSRTIEFFHALRYCMGRLCPLFGCVFWILSECLLSLACSNESTNRSYGAKIWRMLFFNFSFLVRLPISTTKIDLYLIRNRKIDNQYP